MRSPFEQVERVRRQFFLSRCASTKASSSPVLKRPDSMTVATEMNAARGSALHGRFSWAFGRSRRHRSVQPVILYRRIQVPSFAVRSIQGPQFLFLMLLNSCVFLILRALRAAWKGSLGLESCKQHATLAYLLAERGKIFTVLSLPEEGQYQQGFASV